MKTKSILLAVIMTSLSLNAQVEPVNQSEIVASLAAADTPEALYAWERDVFAPVYTGLSDAFLSSMLQRLVTQYNGVGKVSRIQAYETLMPKYFREDWETSTAGIMISYYNDKISQPARSAFVADVQAAASKGAFERVVEDYFATNLMPPRLGHSQVVSLEATVRALVAPAIRVGSDEAVNWALVQYRTATMTDQVALDAAITAVAAALKSTDMNVARANAWVESQNTGSPGVNFTDSELSVPSAISDPMFGLTPGSVESLAAAKAQYRTATTSKQVDAAIYAIATILKASDLNLVRANAWIEAQKTGEDFDLTLQPAID